MDEAFHNGLSSGLSGLVTQLDNIMPDALGDFISSLLGFAVIFLGLWGVYVGIRAILRSVRLLVK